MDSSYLDEITEWKISKFSPEFKILDGSQLTDFSKNITPHFYKHVKSLICNQTDEKQTLWETMETWNFLLDCEWKPLNERE